METLIKTSEAPQSILSTQEPSAPDTPRRKSRGRIGGIDIARGIALIGMFTVHVSVVDFEGGTTLPGWAEWWTSAPSGRASVLFMLLAGVSLSVVRERGSASGSSASIRRRGLVLLVGGLLLTVSFWGASILEHYGLLFLLAPWILARSNKTVAAIAASGLLLGPIVLNYAGGLADVTIFEGETTAWIYRTVTGLLFFGIYPLVVWFGVFAAGILVGRLDLTATKTAASLLVAGLALIALTAGVVRTFDAFGIESSSAGFDESSFEDKTFDDKKFDEKFDDASFKNPKVDPSTLDACWSLPGADFRTPGQCVDEKVFGKDFSGDFDGEFDGGFGNKEAQPLADQLDTSPHSGHIGWAVQSVGIALTILGASLLTPAAVQGVLKPLAMLGSISLTAYLVHIFMVNDIWTPFVEPSNLSAWKKFGALIGLQAGLVLIAVGIRSRWNRGPFEWLLSQLTKPAAAA